jgi:hypothetical protein
MQEDSFIQYTCRFNSLDDKVAKVWLVLKTERMQFYVDDPKNYLSWRFRICIERNKITTWSGVE